MKPLIIIFTGFVWFFFMGIATAEEVDQIDHSGTFIVESKDFEMDDIGEVSVKQLREIEVKWNLNEIDIYIQRCEWMMKYHQIEIEKYEKFMNDYKSLREKVEEAAQKIKLKGKGGSKL